MNHPARSRHQGFTLIEVIVAMAVIALGIGALLSTLTTAASTVSRLRDRSFAEWIALNRISQTRLGTSPPTTGVTTGEVEYAGTKWLWRQEVTNQDVTGILRLNVSVGRPSAKAAKSKSDERFPALATVYGFVGTSVSIANGLDPTWSQTAPPRNPGSPNPGSPNPGSPNPGGQTPETP